jgi:hypothetical protein
MSIPPGWKVMPGVEKFVLISIEILSPFSARPGL